MSNSKISTLTSATTPLAGTETLPIVQSGATKQVSVANLTAGRAVSAASLSLTTTPLPVSSGGTGLTTLTTGYIPFGAGASAFGNTANLFWDNTNARLGSGTATPAAKLHASQTYVAPSTGGISADTVGIFSNNNVGLGTSNVSILSRSSGFQRLYFGNQTVENAQYIESFGNGAGTGYMAFGTGIGTVAGAERMRISFSGGVSIASTTDAGAGNLLMGTGNVVIGTSGKGIDFSATAGTGTSELLADYEEGTFTPTIIGTTTAGTGTYTVQVGRYTKIGNRVAYNIYLSWSAHTGTGNMQIAALPFTSANATNALNPQTLWANNLALTALNYLQAYNNPNTAGIVLQQYPVGGGGASNLPMDTAASIMVSGTYEV
jgi:hypothetical protein